MINLPVANHQAVRLQNDFKLNLLKNSAGLFTEACACSLNVHSIIKPDLLSGPRLPLCLHPPLHEPPFSLFQPIDVFLSFSTTDMSFSIYSESSIIQMRSIESEVKSEKLALPY